MDLFGAFSQMGAYNIAGQEILADLDEKKANAQLAQQKAVAAEGMNAEKKAHAENNVAIGNYLKSLQTLQDSDSITAADTAKQYSKTAEYAASRGDFTGAKEMADLASGKLEEAKVADAAIAKKDVQSKDELSQVAQDLLMTEKPTPEMQNRLYKAAIAAKIPPDAIPMPGTVD